MLLDDIGDQNGVDLWVWASSRTRLCVTRRSFAPEAVSLKLPSGGDSGVDAGELRVPITP